MNSKMPCDVPDQRNPRPPRWIATAMRAALTLLILTVIAAVLCIPWTIAMDLALYAALASQLGDRSMRIATDAIDKTEFARAIGLVFVLMAWTGIVIATQKVVAWISRKNELVISGCD